MPVLEHNTTFISDIESIRLEKKMDYIDAVVHWCENHELDVEYAAALIKKDSIIKLKIQAEAESLNILKKTAQLPI